MVPGHHRDPRKRCGPVKRLLVCCTQIGKPWAQEQWENVSCADFLQINNYALVDMTSKLKLEEMWI